MYHGIAVMYINILLFFKFDIRKMFPRKTLVCVYKTWRQIAAMRQSGFLCTTVTAYEIQKPKCMFE